MENERLFFFVVLIAILILIVSNSNLFIRTQSTIDLQKKYGPLIETKIGDQKLDRMNVIGGRVKITAPLCVPEGSSRTKEVRINNYLIASSSPRMTCEQYTFNNNLDYERLTTKQKQEILLLNQSTEDIYFEIDPSYLIFGVAVTGSFDSISFFQRVQCTSDENCFDEVRRTKFKCDLTDNTCKHPDLIGRAVDNIYCTQDVKQCSDGSYVSRDPKNNCEFRECPRTEFNNLLFLLIIISLIGVGAYFLFKK